MNIMQDRPQRVRWWVKVLVALHLVAIASWSLPNPAPGVMNGKVPPRGNEVLLHQNYQKLKLNPAVRKYLFVTGAWQYWDMFAPNPSSVDVWGDAIVVRKDGTRDTYQYPRIALMPIPQKYMMERYRKFFERVSTEEYSYLWPQFSRVIARKMNGDPANPPVKIILRRHRQPIPKLGEFVMPPYSNEEFFTYTVKSEDLSEEP